MAIIVSNPEILWGVAVFEGTKVPATTLTEYLMSGESLDSFLSDFPSVSREQALGLLRKPLEDFYSLH